MNYFPEFLISAQGFQFTNQYIFTFRGTNLQFPPPPLSLSLSLSLQVPLLALWLIVPRGCNEGRRMAIDLLYSVFRQ